MNPAELPLRDIHLPELISWWPPAPGWWLLTALTLALVVGIVWWLRRRLARRRSGLFLARNELQRLRTAWSEHGDPRRLTRELSTWLRRVSITLFPRREVASLTGAKWWQFLDEVAGTAVFGSEGGKLLAEAPYRASADIDVERLLLLCERWLETAPHATGEPS